MLLSSMLTTAMPSSWVNHGKPMAKRLVARKLGLIVDPEVANEASDFMTKPITGRA